MVSEHSRNWFGALLGPASSCARHIHGQNANNAYEEESGAEKFEPSDVENKACDEAQQKCRTQDELPTPTRIVAPGFPSERGPHRVSLTDSPAFV